MFVQQWFTNFLSNSDWSSYFKYVPTLVIIITLSMFSYYVLKLIWKGSCIKRQLNNVTKKLKNQIYRDANSSLIKFHTKEYILTKSELEEMNKYFEKMNYLEHYWGEFCETLIFKKQDGGNDHIYNTSDADQFFTYENIVEQPLSLDFSRNLPGIFTAMGIMGTFLGIYLGLNKASIALTEMAHSGENVMKASDLLNKAVEQLFIHITPAFLASLCAVLCAVLYLYIEGRWCSSIRASLNNFQRNIDCLFPKATEEVYLLEILIENRLQNTRLSEFGTVLAERIGYMMQDIINKHNELLIQTNNQHISQIGNHIQEKIGPVSADLKDAVQIFKKEQLDQMQGFIDQSIDRFSNSLNNHSEVHLAEIKGVLSETKQAMNGAKNEIEAMFKSIKTEQGKLNSMLLGNINDLQVQHIGLINKHMENATSKNSDIFEKIDRSINTTIETTKQKLTTLIDNSSDVLDKVNEKLIRSVEDTVRKNDTVTSNIVKNTGELLNEIKNVTKESEENLRVRLVEYSDKVNKASSREIELLSKNTSFVVKEMTDLITKNIESIETKMGRLIDSSSNAVNASETAVTKTNEQATVIMELIKKVISQTNDKNEKLLEIIEKNLNKFSETISNMENVNRSFGLQLSQFGDVNNKIIKSSEIMERVTQNIHQFKTAAENLTSSLTESVIVLSKQNSVTLEKFEGVAKGMDTSAMHLNQQLENTISRFDIYFNTYDEKVKTSIGNYLENLDFHLADVLGQLDSDISEIKDFGKDFGVDISRLSDSVKNLRETVQNIPELITKN
ncbi:MAG: hypothetical protein AB2L14_10175 [Candidatus Xenobiia bacterium LiM19]